MLPQEIKQLIGKTGEIFNLEVEKGAIKKLADAVGDRNPLYWDEKYARNSKYGSIVAPPGYFGWPTKWESAQPLRSELMQETIGTVSKSGYSRVLDGGIEYDFYYPVRAGDTLTAVPKVKDIYERESKTGTMVLSVLETTYTNQNGDIVAKARQTLIAR